MGAVFKKTFTKPVPADAEIVAKKGQRFARWRVNGKIRQAPITKGESGTGFAEMAQRLVQISV